MGQENNQWLATIGFSLPKEESTSTLITATKQHMRHYKVIAVDAVSGQPISMKIK
jgi:hypothetical protein